MVYLLHFDSPISKHHTTQHYIGYAADLDARIAEHKAGHGARLTQVARERNIGFVVARTWEGDRKVERQLKNRHEGPRLCPICAARKAGNYELV
jgi:predicted GIY-YIG superfamily endonuclease